MDRKIISIKVPQEGFSQKENNKRIEVMSFADAISLILSERENLQEEKDS